MVEDDGGYRAARADEKAAKARAKSLRPWYKKKRWILGLPILAIIVLAVAGAASGTSSKDSSPATADSTGQAVAASADSAKVGELVKVGSLDLTVTGVDSAFDSTPFNMFNKANVAVHFTATNARGDAGKEYNFILNAFKLVDAAGVAHTTSFYCADCPGEFTTKSLVKGGTIEGTAYFEAPAGTVLKEVLYEPLFSTNKARVSIQ